jgi:hypothetical protein
MKIALFIASSTLVISSGAFAAGEKGHDHDSKGTTAHADDAKASHGGVATVIKDVNYELVARPDVITLYVTDHGKPVNLTGASAKLTLLSTSKQEEVMMTPTSDALQIEGAFNVAAGTKVIAHVTLKGEPVRQVRFSIK